MLSKALVHWKLNSAHRLVSILFLLTIKSLLIRIVLMMMGHFVLSTGWQKKNRARAKNNFIILASFLIMKLLKRREHITIAIAI